MKTLSFCVLVAIKVNEVGCQAMSRGKAVAYPNTVLVGSLVDDGNLVVECEYSGLVRRLRESPFEDLESEFGEMDTDPQHVT